MNTLSKPSYKIQTLATILSSFYGDHGKDMTFWERALDGRFKESKDPIEKQFSVRIHQWYWKKKMDSNISYPDQNRELPDDKRAILDEHRCQSGYHIKNMVEMVVRDLVEVVLKGELVDAKVFLANDVDDTLSSVDLIVEFSDKRGIKRYIGVDIIVSRSERAIKRKEDKRKRTKCRDFNAFRWFDEECSMPRIVLPIDPMIMARFLSEYMEQVSSVGWVCSDDILPLFRSCFEDRKAAHSAREHICERLNSIINLA